MPNIKLNPDKKDACYGMHICTGLWPAVEDFLEKHPEWVLHERYTNNNGLTILKRVCYVS